MKCCQTCANHLGGGDCRINCEDECGNGEYELWEPMTLTQAITKQIERDTKEANQ